MPGIMRKYGRSGPKYPVPEEDHLVVAVDLGKHKLGVAIGTPSELLAAFTVVHRGRAPEVADRVLDAIVGTVEDHYATAPRLAWVCEWPVKYDHDRDKHKDIESLHHVGRCLARWDEKYTPGEWKGQVPKGIHHRRIKKALTAKELELMPSTREHDTWDAAGIYLFAVGRTKKGGV